MQQLNQAWKPMEMQPHVERLTSREAAVMEQLSRGLTVKEAAEAIGVSLNTTKFHVRNIYSKMGVRTRREALESHMNPFGRARA